MDNNYFEITRLQEKFKQYYENSENKRADYIAPADYARRGGFFRKRRRKQLLRLLGKSGGRTGKNTKSFFWTETKEKVETALIDLLLFIRTGEDKVQEVIKKETLQPIIEALFFPFDIQDVPKPDGEKAKIALMLVENGLKYLQETSPLISKNQIRTFEDAKEASQILTALQLLPNESKPMSRSGRA